MGLASKLAAAQANSGAAYPPASMAFGQQMAPPTSFPPAPNSGTRPPPSSAPRPAQQGSYPGQLNPFQNSQQPPQGSGAPPAVGPRPGQYPGQQSPYGGQQYQQQPPAPYGQQQYGAPTTGYPPQGQYPGQQSYGQPPAYSAQAPAAAPSGQSYVTILEQAVRENKLQAFYPPQRIQEVASRISNQVDVVAQQWNVPKELAVDVVRLALYDIVLFVDDSGSMAFEENGERIEDLKLILQRCAFAATLFDTDGIEVRFMNSNLQGNNVRSEQQAIQLINQVKFQGLTPLGTNLRKKVLDPLVVSQAKSRRLKKPVMVITITDGQPAGESSSTVFSAIKDAKRALISSPFGDGALALQFGQVGNDLKARQFLGQLDTDHTVGGMVDCTSNYEVEQDEMARKGVELTPSAWIVKLLLGAIDKSYDSLDE